MTRRNSVFTVLAGIALVLIFAAPVGPLPGFFIGGKATPIPEIWSDTSKLDEILLKVPGALPRVVIIWVVQVEGQLYVVGSGESGWVQRIGQGAPVEMRLRDRRYLLTATPVSSGLESIITTYKDKYRPNYPDIVAGFPSLEGSDGAYGVFRLDPRSE